MDLEERTWSHHRRLRTQTPALRAVRQLKGFVQQRDAAEVPSIAGWVWENVSQNADRFRIFSNIPLGHTC